MNTNEEKDKLDEARDKPSPYSQDIPDKTEDAILIHINLEDEDFTYMTPRDFRKSVKCGKTKSNLTFTERIKDKIIQWLENRLAPGCYMIPKNSIYKIAKNTPDKTQNDSEKTILDYLVLYSSRQKPPYMEITILHKTRKDMGQFCELAMGIKMEAFDCLVGKWGMHFFRPIEINGTGYFVSFGMRTFVENRTLVLRPQSHGYRIVIPSDMARALSGNTPDPITLPDLNKHIGTTKIPGDSGNATLSLDIPETWNTIFPNILSENYKGVNPTPTGKRLIRHKFTWGDKTGFDTDTQILTLSGGCSEIVLPFSKAQGIASDLRKFVQSQRTRPLGMDGLLSFTEEEKLHIHFHRQRNCNTE